jgi:hypothetical protein
MDAAPFPAATVKRYINFRIWRRLWNRRTEQSLLYRKQVMQELYRPSTYLHMADLKVTLRIFSSILRKKLRSRKISSANS